jgi:methionyl-tRNA formyltransferase
MRFAVTATDRYLNVFRAFVERGWTAIRVFTTAVDDRMHRTSGVIEYARHLKTDVQISRLTEDNLRDLADRGCEALVVASYQWRIGDWRPYLKYAVNFHPGLLPRGRGAYPTPVPILEQCATWGISCHKVEPEFDTGDVLSCVEFPIAPTDDHDCVDLKLQLAGGRLAAAVAGNFVELWNRAIPQGEGTYYPLWSDAERTLDFSQPVESILRRVRAFGPIESIARINNTTLFVRRAVGWTEAHRIPAGTVVYATGLSLVVAAADGYIGLTEWSLIKPDAVTGSLRR